MSIAAWISGGTTGSIDRQPAAWKPPIATGRPSLMNWRARSTARGNWLDCTPTMQISALAAAAADLGGDAVGLYAGVGLVVRRDEDVYIRAENLTLPAISAQAIEGGQRVGRNVGSAAR